MIRFRPCYILYTTFAFVSLTFVWQCSSLLAEWDLVKKNSIDSESVIKPDGWIEQPFKKILFWNEAYGNKEYGIGLGRDVFRRAGCPVWQCETTDDRSSIPVEQFDAVVFHLRSWSPKDVPQRRLPHQRYVFWSLESPAWRYVDTNLMGDFFNWTMTYRWDSDVVNPYGWIAPKGSLPLLPDPDQLLEKIAQTRSVRKNYAAGKKKMAAWFVSNCVSLSSRDIFVRRLKDFIDVDQFGECSSMKCPRADERTCRQMVEKDYKFYLSLENSLCADYVTEKFFGMLHYDVIPIVVDVHGSHDRFAPPHSFINAARFGSVKKLTDYLTELDRNDTLYNEYFWWKPHYEVRDSKADVDGAMCRLCAALHRPLPRKIYHNMTEWWEDRSNCQRIKYPKEVHKKTHFRE